MHRNLGHRILVHGRRRQILESGLRRSNQNDCVFKLLEKRKVLIPLNFSFLDLGLIESQQGFCFRNCVSGTLQKFLWQGLVFGRNLRELVEYAYFFFERLQFLFLGFDL